MLSLLVYVRGRCSVCCLYRCAGTTCVVALQVCLVSTGVSCLYRCTGTTGVLELQVCVVSTGVCCLYRCVLSLQVCLASTGVCVISTGTRSYPELHFQERGGYTFDQDEDAAKPRPFEGGSLGMLPREMLKFRH